MRAWMLPLSLVALVGCSGDETDPPVEPTPTKEVVAAEALLPSGCGHAHNDYEHPQPLTDALSRGFCSIEVDVFLVDGELLVAHAMSEIDPTRTLRGLYLDPLAERHSELGPVGGGSLILLIDVKSEAEATYAAIDGILTEYADLFTSFEDGTVHAGVVTALISGNRDRATLEGQTLRYAALDGRPSDFETGVPVHLMPLVSQSWNAYFAWEGTGTMPAEELTELEGFIATAHGEGRRMRFWASPDAEPAWATQLDAGLDLVNTDDLAGFEAYLATR